MTSDLLLHPEIFDGLFLGEHLRDSLAKNAERLAQGTPFDDMQPISIVIRTRNDAANIEKLADEIKEQDYAGSVELVLVDTESSDGTPRIARHSGLDVTVASIAQHSFSYPKALNLGFQAAGAERVFSTVGHANFSNVQTLRAIAKHLDSQDIAGVFGPTLPGVQASRTERLLGCGILPDLKKGGTAVRKAGMGVLAATNAAISRTAWQELKGFDERYGAGGEDTDFAKRLLEAGYGLVCEPTLAVHHSHGLGPINSLRQVSHWHTILKGPQPFDTDEVAHRRPDLRR